MDRGHVGLSKYPLSVLASDYSLTQLQWLEGFRRWTRVPLPFWEVGQMSDLERSHKRSFI